MKVRKLIGNLGKLEILTLVQEAIDSIGQGAEVLLGRFEEIDSPQFLLIELDENKKVLSFTAKDGSHYAYNLKSETIDALAEQIKNLKIELNEEIVDLSEEIDNINQLENFDNIGDFECRVEIVLDQELHILSYRDKNGIKYETAGIVTPNIKVDTINLSEEGLTDFSVELKEKGLGMGYDFSNIESPVLPLPTHYTLLNIKINKLPINDSDEFDAIAEYYDFQGNYFKKHVTLEAQGQTSRIFARTGGKGNYTINFDDDIKFGDWVPLDSFHLKGCAKDVTKGYLVTSYRLGYILMKELNANPSRVLMDENEITLNTGTGDFITDWPQEARCIPDGFPCEVYINGEYHGMYAFQLKKHRKNYLMDKKDYTSLFLDADMMMSNDHKTGIWNNGPDSRMYPNSETNLSTWWNGFDIKGPKDLYTNVIDDVNPHCYFKVSSTPSEPALSPNNVNPEKLTETDIINIRGSIENAPLYLAYKTNTDKPDQAPKYDYYKLGIRFKAFDGDHPKELLGTETPGYDSSNKAYKGTTLSKSIIRSFSTKYLEVRDSMYEEAVDGYYKKDANNNYVQYIDGDGEITRYNLKDDLSESKSLFNNNFDYNACMLVYIFNCLLNNADSIKKNTLWAIYKNGKIAPLLWDVDGVYGVGWIGILASNPSRSLWTGAYATAEWPLGLFWKLYEPEIKAQYCKLRDGILNMSTWKNVVYGWANSIGTEAYKKDIEKWPETPSYREDNTNTGFWERNYTSESIGNVPLWDENTLYNVGDLVSLKLHSTSNWCLRYTAKVANLGKCPISTPYELFPIAGGFYDSPKRMEKWMDQQMLLCDVINGCTKDDIYADFTAYRNTESEYTIDCYNIQLKHPDLLLGTEYVYIEGHITKCEKVEDGETVTYYTITDGKETDLDTTKLYTTVQEAVLSASELELDTPSLELFYLKVRTKNIKYYKH